MKKVFIIGLSALLLAGCGEEKKNEEPKEDKPVEYVSIFEKEEYKNIELDNINSISKIRYTEAGDDRSEITDEEEIKQLYNGLKAAKVGEEVQTACEDNTTVYVFNLKDGSSPAIEIECEWFVINGKRYNIVN